MESETLDDKVIDATLTEWAAALEIEPGELQKLFTQFLTEERAAHAQLTADQWKERALRRVRIRAKREHGPQAMVTGTADAIILGVSGRIDNMQVLRDEAITLYRENPKQAILLGVTDDKGQPLDNRRTFPGSGKPNPFYGKVLRQHNYLSIITGLASIERDGKKEMPVLFSSIVDRNVEGATLPALFHRVKFAITGSEYVEKQKVWRLGLPKGVQFQDVGVADPIAMVRKFAPDVLVSLEHLEAWAKSHDPRELVGVEGDVVRMDLAPVELGRNRRLQIDNGHDIRGFGTTVWVHDELPIDFAEESKVTVFGNVRMGNPDSGFGASINAMGLYVNPDYRTALPEGIKPFPEPRSLSPVVEDPALAALRGQADTIFGTGTDAPMAPPQKPTSVPAEAEMFVFACIAKVAKESPGRGAHLDEVLNRSIQAGFNRTDVEFSVNELLERSRIYEAELGFFKTLEEATKAEVAFYTLKGGK